MAEYIDKEALLRKVHELQGGSCSTGLIVEQIEKAPAVDLVEVVRCGQCGHYCKNTGECNLCGRHPSENDFCSSGKKEQQMTKQEKIIIPAYNDDFGAVLNCAVRYVYGRATYMPELVCKFITPLLPKLNDNTLKVFKNDIEDEQRFYNSASISELYNADVWDKFYKAVQEELSKRSNK